MCPVYTGGAGIALDEGKRMKANMPITNDKKKLKARPRPELLCPQEP
jgi:hypothetical protein